LGFRVQGSGFRVEGLRLTSTIFIVSISWYSPTSIWFRVLGFGFGFKVEGLKFRFLGLGFRI